MSLTCVMIKVNKKIHDAVVRFSPSFYNRAYKSFKRGDPRDVIEMMNIAETDSQVFGCLNGRRAGFQRQFTLTHESRADDAARVTRIIKKLGPRKLFKAIQVAVLKKFSVIDFEWEIVDGWQVPVSFKPLPHKYFKFVDDELRLDFGKTTREIEDTALVCLSDEIPVLLPVLRDYILKTFGLEGWASFLERFGEGIILGSYPPGAGDPIKEELNTAVNTVASSSRGTKPDNTDIEIVESARSTGDYDKFNDVCDTGIAITILGHANAVKQSKGLQVGENNSTYNAKRDIILDDIYYIEPYMQQLVDMIWTRNIGSADSPEFVIDKKDPVSISDTLEIIESYASLGGEVDPSEYARLGLNIPESQKPLKREQIPGGF
ncbi:MAG: DUF935 family protein [FCB group bacterium]|nr:DUF935 family protein [FCB group bacterium]MBL7027429.1 DUF935 family protein [Candidatus Neomarinimicrobiota bacterium]MBL7122589.1 DUF935 family protein [Candidatus Neomarinimicrobiota bacterium]